MSHTIKLADYSVYIIDTKDEEVQKIIRDASFNQLRYHNCGPTPIKVIYNMSSVAPDDETTEVSTYNLLPNEIITFLVGEKLWHLSDSFNFLFEPGWEGAIVNLAPYATMNKARITIANKTNKIYVVNDDKTLYVLDEEYSELRVLVRDGEFICRPIERPMIG